MPLSRTQMVRGTVLADWKTKKCFLQGACLVTDTMLVASCAVCANNHVGIITLLGITMSSYGLRFVSLLIIMMTLSSACTLRLPLATLHCCLPTPTPAPAPNRSLSSAEKHDPASGNSCCSTTVDIVSIVAIVSMFKILGPVESLLHLPSGSRKDPGMLHLWPAGSRRTRSRSGGAGMRRRRFWTFGFPL